ncbi:MAG: 30S ribosomal protein S9 [Thermoguttaceae bacterium]|jgi:small subunit ribosomal protein S9
MAATVEIKGSPNDILGTGRRKTSVARVRVSPGKGRIVINDRPLDEYFHNVRQRNAVLAPLVQTGKREELDVLIRVDGGGITGQADACKLGIARAMKKYSDDLLGVLRDSGLLTRDGRMKERKKYGLRGARRGTQFSKR